MVIKIIIIIVIFIIFFSDIVEVVSGTKAGNYYLTYEYLGSTTFLMLIQVLYEKKYKDKIFRNAMSTKYSWININEEELDKVLINYNKISLERKFDTLDIFTEYKNHGYDADTSKKIQKEQDLYDRIKKIMK